MKYSSKKIFSIKENRFLRINIGSLLFDISLIAFSYIYSHLLYNDIQITEVLNNRIILILFILFELLFPLYIGLILNNYNKFYKKFKSFYDHHKSLLYAFLFSQIAVITFIICLTLIKKLETGFIAIFILVSLNLMMLVFGGYFAKLLSEDIKINERFIFKIYENDVKSFLLKLNNPIIRIIIDFLMVSFLCLWFEILSEEYFITNLSIDALFFRFIFSGYLPVRLLIEFEPPIRPINILISIMSFIYFFLVISDFLK